MRQHIKDMFITLLAPILLIFFIETFSRAYLISPSQINAWGYNAQGLGDLLPNRNFIADEGPLPYRVITNSQGLRSNKEFAIPKPKEKFRILAIGDSITFGPYVNQQDTYPDRLEQILKNSEVINAGIAGYTLEDELSYLQEKGLKLHPDLIILQIYQNDIDDYAPVVRQIYSRKSHKQNNNPIYNLAKKSATLTAIEKIITTNKITEIRKQAVSITKKESDYYDNYFQDLEKLDTFITQNKLPILFVFFPSYEQLINKDYQPQRKINEKIANHHPVLDLFPIFEKQENPYALYLLPANNHLSAYGNFIAASVIASETAKFYNESK